MSTVSGQRSVARPSLQRLSELAECSGTDLALGLRAYSLALVADDRDAEDLFREALDRLSRTRVTPRIARAHLLYGEWLRGERRRLDARERLRTAHEMFVSMGAEAFASRAARELAATGERAPKPRVETRSRLTAQEAPPSLGGFSPASNGTRYKWGGSDRRPLSDGLGGAPPRHINAARRPTSRPSWPASLLYAGHLHSALDKAAQGWRRCSGLPLPRSNAGKRRRSIPGGLRVRAGRRRSTARACRSRRARVRAARLLPPELVSRRRHQRHHAMYATTAHPVRRDRRRKLTETRKSWTDARKGGRVAGPSTDGVIELISPPTSARQIDAIRNLVEVVRSQESPLRERDL